MSAAPFPIRPLSLAAENFRGLGGTHTLDFSRGLAVLVGKNGAGKSSLLVAVEWCLFGKQTTKKTDSGIAERGDWALAHHGATGDVRVSLELAVEGGPARLTRLRAAGAKARDEDQVQLELPEHEVLSGQEVDDWLVWNNMPDWSTWKRSFCQHQEQSRARVTDAADRSTAIAGMLGLEEFRTLNEDLRQLRVKKLEQRAADELARLQEEHRRAFERPGLVQNELEDRLAQGGLASGQAGEVELAERKRKLLDDAAEVAARTGLNVAQIPPVSAPADELLAWARAWSGEVRRKADTLASERVELSSRAQMLEASIGSLEPARTAASAAEHDRERLEAELGSVTELAKKRTELEGERRRLDAVGKLIQDALEVVKSAPDPHVCPVCDHERSDLEQVVQGRLDARGSDALAAELEQLRARDADLRAQLDRVESAVSTQTAARAQVTALEQGLRDQLPEGASEGAAMDETLRALRAAEGKVSEAGELAEQHISHHGESLELLELMIQLHDARARASAQAGELADTPEFQEFQRVNEEATDFANDIKALGDMARGLEDEQADEQLTAVNASIGTYFTTITGDSGRGRVRVQSKRTPAKVSYQFIDEAGRPITSHLNQAAFNALSLATLFASADSRVRRGLPQFLVLDDPGQSLDEDHQAGLARALAECASFAPVIVGTVPGSLANALSGSGGADARTYQLERAKDGMSTVVREE
jgi:DNA repair protein SbcC/Rad50